MIFDMVQNKSYAAVLFADLARSTQLYDRLGDKTAESIIADCLACLTDTTRKYDGEVIKTIGDEVMSVFESVDKALRCAARMHQAIETLTLEDVAEPVYLYLHIGICSGLVIRRQDDVFGDAVNLAARLTKLASPRQIVVTGHMAEQVEPARRKWFRPIGRETIKGKSGIIETVEYLWDRTDTTVLLDRIQTPRTGEARLELRFGNCIRRVDEERSECTIGRKKGNDIVLNFERISRFHAKIVQRRHKFMLKDHSSNGTYVDFGGQHTAYLKRDEIQLTGSGMISPGRKASPNSPGALHFCVIESSKA